MGTIKFVNNCYASLAVALGGAASGMGYSLDAGPEIYSLGLVVGLAAGATILVKGGNVMKGYWKNEQAIERSCMIC